MVQTQQVECLIQMLWYGNYIRPEELRTLSAKLTVVCSGEYIELEEEKVISCFDANTLPEALIRIGIRKKAYAEPVWMKWLEDTIRSDEFKNERTGHKGT
mgnify:CR=1 FL=1